VVLPFYRWAKATDLSAVHNPAVPTSEEGVCSPQTQPDKRQSHSSRSCSHILSRSYSASLFLVCVVLFLHKEMGLSMVFQCKLHPEGDLLHIPLVLLKRGSLN